MVTKVGKSDGEGTLAGARGNGEDAPISAVRQLTPGPQGFDPKAAVPALGE
jgi:hypothetical protein